MQGHEASHGSGGAKSSSFRLILITIVMVGFAALSWGLAIFSKGVTHLSGTSTNLPNIFIPAWLTLTIATVIVSMWFARRLLEAERYRDSETVTPAAPAHSH